MNGPGLQRRRPFLVLLCLVLWGGGLLVTHAPPARLPNFHVRDLLLHFVGYFVLGGIFWLCLLAFGVRRRRRILTVLLVLAAYGAFDELTQPIFGRTASVADWAADMAGTAAALLVGEMLVRLGGKRSGRQ